MSFIRTDQQVALNELLVTARETLDHYQDAAEMLKGTPIGTALMNLAHQRQPFISRLENAVRALGDLPSVPDPDKEAGAMLMHHLSAFLTAHYESEVVQQRLEGEKKLTNLIEAAKAVGLEQAQTQVLDQFAEHVTYTDQQLHLLQQEFAD